MNARNTILHKNCEFKTDAKLQTRFHAWVIRLIRLSPSLATLPTPSIYLLVSQLCGSHTTTTAGHLFVPVRLSSGELTGKSKGTRSRNQG
jgi:hypothetical protein